MPRQPNWLDKIQFIRFYISNQCNTPWVVYWETALESLWHQVIVLVEFDLFDIIRELFRPKGLRSGRHGRKPRRRSKNLIPQTEEMATKLIPGHEIIPARTVSQGVKNLWIIDGIFQRVLYYVLIFNIVEDFWYDWLIGIFKNDRTRCEGMGRGMARGSPSVNNSGGWGGLKTNIPVYNEPQVNVGDEIAVVGAGNYMFNISADVQQWIPNPDGAQAELGLQVWGGDFEFLAVSGRIDVPIGSKLQLIATAYVKGPATIACRAFTHTQGINSGLLWTEQVYLVLQLGT